MSELAAWGLSSIGWALFGLLIGWVLGRVTREVRRIAAAVTVDEGETPVADNRRTVRHRLAQLPRLSGQNLLVIVVVALGVLTVVQGLIASADTQRLNQCIARYSNGFADALEARSRSSEGSQRALDELVTRIGARLDNPRATPGIAAALNDYQQKRRMAVQLRQRNPYPPPPRDVCNR